MNITRGKVKGPRKLVLHGKAGTGKTTFASEAPSPIVVMAEDGARDLDVAKTPVAASATHVLEMLDELGKEEYAEFKTIVLDTVDSFDALAQGEVCKRMNVESVGEIPYGAGYSAVESWHVELRKKLDRLFAAGKMVIVLGHSAVKKVSHPVKGEYDNLTLSMRPNTAQNWVDWGFDVLYLEPEFSVLTDGNKKRAMASGRRMLHCVGTPAFEAKNRCGLPESFAFEIGSGFSTYLSAWK